MEWLWISPSIVLALLIAVLYGHHLYVRSYYIPVVMRIFQEKPLFILPFGKPVPEAEEITLTTPDGLRLQACYLRTPKPRKGVIFFGLEFGSNRWSCLPYTNFLRDAGYDIFTFEMRGQGNSALQPGYEPLQWVTNFDMIDFTTAVAYLKTRPDRDPRGVGLFGLSKGGSAGLMAAADDDFIRCFVVDGVFACHTTVIPFMLKWIHIYTQNPWLMRFVPVWYFRYIGVSAIHQVERERKCLYPPLERCMSKLAPRPLFMIHGGADTYIRPDMAQALFDLARDPKEYWLVERAKHNQSFHLAAEEYQKRVLAFFDLHLAGPGGPPAANGSLEKHAVATESTAS